MELFSGLLLITIIGMGIALMLTKAAGYYPEGDDEVVAQINKLLPQTQCGQCNHPGCKPYAQAIAAG